MHVITTVSPENSSRAVLPFVTAKGAMARGDSVAIFACSEATYFGSENHADPTEVISPGLGSVADSLDSLLENDALEEYILCGPCAESRGIAEQDLHAWATLGGADDLARQAEEHDTTVTF